MTSILKTGSLKILIIALIINTLPAIAAEPEMADTMRSEGKIYVVVAIIILVLAGVASYLFLLDRKISRLEQSSHEKNR